MDMVKTDQSSTLYDDALEIARRAIENAHPGSAVERALEGREFPGRVVMVAVGKAAFPMAQAACDTLQGRLNRGFIICDPAYLPESTGDTLTSHGSPLPSSITLLPAEHPIPDEATATSTRKVIENVSSLSTNDTVLFLLSGGASSMFEAPLIELEEMREITEALLMSGADISQINAVRKRLSSVKAGRFTRICAPAHVLSLILSDIPDGSLDAVGSGPTCPDSSTCDEALQALTESGYRPDATLMRLIRTETPKHLDNVENVLIGDASLLVQGAVDACRDLGYEPTLLDSPITGEARDVGRKLARISDESPMEDVPGVFRAWIGTGETTVTVQGAGLGGRNLEVALSAATILDERENRCVLSVGSDGRDGPTDVAGGYADGTTMAALRSHGIDAIASLDNNDSYHALEATDGLIRTGVTGTNVGDFMLVLRKD